MALLVQYFCEHWAPSLVGSNLSTHSPVIEIICGSSMCIYASALSLPHDDIIVVHCVTLILIVLIAIVFHFLPHNEHPY
jgi:hypothetical protein